MIKRLIAQRLRAPSLRAAGWLAGFAFRLARLHNIAPPPSFSHTQWPNALAARFNKPGLRILEIGSRNVTGSNFRHRFTEAEYIGFDYYDGENVDIKGDIHRLSSYFKEHEKFDLIFSSAVFEHLYMPWIAVQEIQKILKLGGFVFVETHFSYSAHERPWNFFQFSDMGLRVLFNKALGFEVIECGLSNRMAGFFSCDADAYLRYQAIPELYCHSEIFCQKVAEVTDFDWGSLAADDIVDGTRYPPPA